MPTAYTDVFFNAAEMEKLLFEVFDAPLAAINFSYVGKNQWIRETGAPFKHVFYFWSLKPGYSLYPAGGLTFDYVPTIKAGKAVLPGQTTDFRPSRVAGPGLGSDLGIERERRMAKKQCKKLLGPVINEINDALNEIRSVESALKLLTEKKKTTPDLHLRPDAALAYVFTLAKAGQQQLAVSELNQLLKKNKEYFPKSTHQPLLSFLSQTRPD